MEREKQLKEYLERKNASREKVKKAVFGSTSFSPQLRHQRGGSLLRKKELEPYKENRRSGNTDLCNSTSSRLTSASRVLCEKRKVQLEPPKGPREGLHRNVALHSFMKVSQVSQISPQKRAIGHEAANYANYRGTCSSVGKQRGRKMVSKTSTISIMPNLHRNEDYIEVKQLLNSNSLDHRSITRQISSIEDQLRSVQDQQRLMQDQLEKLTSMLINHTTSQSIIRGAKTTPFGFGGGDSLAISSIDEFQTPFVAATAFTPVRAMATPSNFARELSDTTPVVPPSVEYRLLNLDRNLNFSTSNFTDFQTNKLRDGVAKLMFQSEHERSLPHTDSHERLATPNVKALQEVIRNCCSGVDTAAIEEAAEQLQRELQEKIMNLDHPRPTAMDAVVDMCTNICTDPCRSVAIKIGDISNASNASQDKDQTPKKIQNGGDCSPIGNFNV